MAEKKLRNKTLKKSTKSASENISENHSDKGNDKNNNSINDKFKASKVIIVESPAKAKTIEHILGEEYQVISSKGHVRDLPQKEFGVDLKTFNLDFEIIPGKEQVVEQIKKIVKNKEVLLASDPDREGEAIAWHLSTILNVKGNNRITFSEITPKAIIEAVKSPREIDMNKVNAQLARRVLDRIVGYKISPILWKILKDARSAGRVQSAALKIICERERERVRFVPQKYYKVWIELAGLKANLTKLGDKKLKPTEINEEIAKTVLEKVREVELFNIDITEVKKSPPSPFITSTLQQDASTKLGFPVAKTMKIAQDLYEGMDTPEGHIAFITYMRTDSTRISDEAKSAAKDLILNLFGEEYFGSETEQTAKKSKKKEEKGKIQDAHECIRPVNVFLTPEKASKLLDKEHLKLYELIWKRFIASQMKNAVYKQYSYDFKSGEYIFEAAIRERLFDGFEAVYSIDDEKSEEHKELKVGEKYTVIPKIAESKTTPPDRYSEATLVKILETEGIGRPSTYATIIQTLLYRNYIVKRGRSLVPTILGFVVNDFLEKHFPEIVDKGFTAKMEKNLDEIENGHMDWKDVIKKFFNEFEKDLKKTEKVFFSIDYETDKNCENCGSSYRLRVGKYGLYLNCPKCSINQSLSIKEFGVLLDEKVYFTQITDEEQDNGDPSEGKKNSKKTNYSSLNSSKKKKNTKNTKNAKSEKVTDSTKSTKRKKAKK